MSPAQAALYTDLLEMPEELWPSPLRRHVGRERTRRLSATHVFTPEGVPLTVELDATRVWVLDWVETLSERQPRSVRVGLALLLAARTGGTVELEIGGPEVRLR